MAAAFSLHPFSMCMFYDYYSVGGWCFCCRYFCSILLLFFIRCITFDLVAGVFRTFSVVNIIAVLVSSLSSSHFIPDLFYCFRFFFVLSSPCFVLVTLSIFFFSKKNNTYETNYYNASFQLEFNTYAKRTNILTIR